MIFPSLIYDPILQVDDKQRFTAEKTFITPDEGEITKIEFSFDNGVTYMNVFQAGYENRWFVDYAYDLAADEIVKLKVTTTLGEKIKDYLVSIITSETDRLFSSDDKIFALEGELKNLMPRGRNSYKNKHREAQSKIIRYLDGEGLRKKNKMPFNKEELYDNTYIREWALYQVLVLIYEDLSVKTEDKYKEKVATYTGQLVGAIKNATIRLDYNEDGEVLSTEIKNAQVKFLSR